MSAMPPGLSPGQRAAGVSEPPPAAEDSVPEAMGIIAKAVAATGNPQAAAALKTVASALEEGPQARPAHAGTSPGMQAAAAHMPPQ